MDDPEAAAERIALISRMFALLTAKFEDAAGIAAEGQGRRPPGELLDKAQELMSLAAEAATLTEAVLALLDRPDAAGST